MMEEQKHKYKSVEDYFSLKKTTFWSLLKSTKKWKELYNQKESKLAFVFSLIITTALCIVYNHCEFETYISLLEDITMFAIESSIGMLGFIISGLAIFTGTITNKLVKNINSDRKIDSLIGILFSFYFIGMIIALSVVWYLIVYIFLASDFIFEISKLIAIGLLCTYLYMYAVFYSVSLLGTCIRLFFVSYKYSIDLQEEKERKE